ncbi:MAG TPA: type II secretion system protein, partial [Patescibacteria group bacterium]|nr:type II secretion system protein [Patescibacteria group bacterium]
MKNKGFTLVELLAVIVILGIIMLIATPLIINVISDARKGVFKNSAYGLVKTGENEYMLNQLNGETKNLIYEFSDGEISGFWIAKFEPSVANQNDSCYIDSNKTNC